MLTIQFVFFPWSIIFLSHCIFLCTLYFQFIEDAELQNLPSDTLSDSDFDDIPDDEPLPVEDITFLSCTSTQIYAACPNRRMLFNCLVLR